MRNFFTLPLLALAISLPLVGCVALAQSGDSPERQRAVVAELFEAISNADIAKLDELYADDFEIWTAGTLPFSGSSKKAQSLEGMRMIDGLFPEGLAFTILATTVEGDRVAVEAVSEGVAASGERYHNQYHFLVIVRGGKVHALKEYMDTQHAKEVLVDSMAEMSAGSEKSAE
jgi:ketosteroid isomerase-like protein